MATVILNTLDFADKLKAGGFTAQQAEAQAHALAEVIEKQIEIEAHEMGIKRDIQASENRLEVKIEALRIELKRDIKELELSFKKDMEILKAESKRDVAEAKAELIRWVVGVGLLQSTLIIGVLMKVAHLI